MRPPPLSAKEEAYISAMCQRSAKEEAYIKGNMDIYCHTGLGDQTYTVIVSVFICQYKYVTSYKQTHFAYRLM